MTASLVVAGMALLALVVLCGIAPAVGAVAGVGLGVIFMRGFHGPIPPKKEKP